MAPRTPPQSAGQLLPTRGGDSGPGPGQRAAPSHSWACTALRPARASHSRCIARWPQRRDRRPQRFRPARAESPLCPALCPATAAVRSTPPARRPSAHQRVAIVARGIATARVSRAAAADGFKGWPGGCSSRAVPPIGAARHSQRRPAHQTTAKRSPLPYRSTRRER